MKMKTAAMIAATLFLASVSILAQGAEFYPIELVKPGQKGQGKTIFNGSEIGTFDVEVLGVLENFGPQQSAVLARLSGGDIERTGVFEGMSGSPVYLEGRLLGAVAFSFPFSREAIAGITPIRSMVDAFKDRPPLARKTARGFSPDMLRGLHGDSLIPPFSEGHQLASLGRDSGQNLRPIATPLNLSGFSPETIKAFQPAFDALGLVAVRGLAGESPTDYKTLPVQPGSTVAVQLMRGDVSVSASGTITHVSGDKVYAFGHPFLSLGTTEMPMNLASVLTVIPSLYSSQKVSAIGQPIGVLRGDRSTGIYGVMGQEPEMLPIRLKLLTSRNEVREFRYEVVKDAFLTPLMINLSVHNAIISSERSLGGQTLRVKCDIKVKNQPNVIFESNVASFVSTPAMAAVTLSAPVGILLNSGFEDLDVERVSFEVTSIEEAKQAELVRVWQDKLEAKPGEEVTLSMFLRTSEGKTELRKYPFRIPEGIAAGPLKIEVGDGLSVSRNSADRDDEEFVPENPHQLIKAINNLKTNDRLYVRLYRDQAGAVIGGEGMPDLPPSLLALYRARKTSGAVKPIQRVVYAELELTAMDYVLSGHKSLRIDVKS